MLVLRAAVRDGSSQAGDRVRELPVPHEVAAELLERLAQLV